MSANEIAPPLQIREWLNTSSKLSLDALRGKVVVIEAFQMLCPGCVSHGLPQAQRIYESFSDKEVAVIGLHTVFEHHEAQGSRAALEAFVHEYRFTFPIGIDLHDAAGVPQTMQAYEMRGTPTLILIDRLGRRRMQHFGRMDDMRVGATIMSLVQEASARVDRSGEKVGFDCDADGCVISR